MIYQPLFRLVLSVLERPEDKARAYAVVIDPVAGKSGIYLDGVPWASEYFSGEMGEAQPTPRHLPGPLGLVSLRTSETMQNHSCSLGLSLGEVGAELRKRLLPHDPLRVEMFDQKAGVWFCAFDGHVSSVQWSRQSSPGSYRWRMDVSAQGLQKVFSEQWLDWQSMIRAADGKFNSSSKAFSFFKELADIKGDLPVSELMDMFIAGAVDKFLEFGVRGVRAGIVRPDKLGTFQTSANGRDWRSAWDLFVFATGNWYLMQQGPIWSLLSGLAEPDVHEFYITYQSLAGVDEYREIPTVVFRPRPWPGPPAYAVTAQGATDADDSIWPELQVVKTGLPGGAPAAFSVGTSRSDGARSNAFFISLAGASDSTPGSMNAAKYALGFRVDEGLVKRYGFSSRQVSIGSYLKRADEYFHQILPAVLDRVAWQDAPLPFLLDQTRAFPLMPGVHVGSVLQDHSESLDAPTTGYIISVSHSLSGSPKGLSAETTIGTTRAIEGVTAEGYPTAVRKFVNLQQQMFLDGPGVKEKLWDFKAPAHSQPSSPLSSLVIGPFDCGVSNHPGLQDTPTRAVSANLTYLVERGIEPVHKIAILSLGPIVLTSVYRSVALNAKVGGRADSDHMKGLAFDFQMANGSVSDLNAVFEKLKMAKASLGYKECILETKGGKTWIHYAIPAAGGPALGTSGLGETGE